MSMALCDIIPIMDLIQEKKDQHIPFICSNLYVYYKVFEDNAGALELVRLPMLHPRTKHTTSASITAMNMCTRGSSRLPSRNL